MQGDVKMTARWIRQGAIPLTLALLLAASTMEYARGSPALWGRHMGVAPVGHLGAPDPLPPGYTLYTSKALPYRIGYPSGWQAEGSIFGNVRRPTGIYYDADIFSKRGVASIQIQGEGLPPGSLFTSMCYRELELLDLQRAKEGDLSLIYTATRGGTIAVDGTQAYLLGVTRRTSSGTTRITEALWVARGRAWKAGLVILSARTRRDALLPVFTTMLQTFQQH